MKHQEDLTTDSTENNTRYKNPNHSPSANMSRKKEETNPSNFSVTLAGPTFVNYDGQNSHPQPHHSQPQIPQPGQQERQFTLPYSYDGNGALFFLFNSHHKFNLFSTLW
jgi:hypothetical protein